MSIWDRIPRLRKEKRSIYLDENGKPKTIISTGKGIEKGQVTASSDRTEALLKSYRDYYEGENTVFAAINTTAWNTIMVGYNLISEDDNAKLLIKEYLSKINLDSTLLDGVIFALVYGDSFIEIVRNSKGDVTNLKNVDPITMNVLYDKFGVTTGYQQKIGGKLQASILKPEDIIHIKFFSKPSSPYGLSLIEPSKETIDRKVSTDEAITNAFIRHGTPKLLIKVGTPEEIPPTSVFTDIKNELEDITELNELIVPGLIDITAIDEKGVPGVDEIGNIFQTQLVIGMLCPEEALGLGKGSTEATAKIKEVMYERFIKSIQTKLAYQIRNELINPILEKNRFEINTVHIKFNSVTDADEAVKSKWLGNLLRGYPAGKQPFTINEVRSMFDYPPVEDGDELIVVSQPNEENEKPKKEPPKKKPPKKEPPKEKPEEGEESPLPDNQS